MKTKITRSNVVWTYDRRSPIGTLGKASDETVAKGWIVVSMKDDWKAIFPPTGIKQSGLSPDCNNYRIVIRRNTEAASA